jgi:hypothetical protein
VNISNNLAASGSVTARAASSGRSASDKDIYISGPECHGHGKVRYQQGYTPEMLGHESRILQVTIFRTLQNNLNYLDFSLLLPDVMANRGMR